MKAIEAYKSVDGKLFEDEDKAIAHDSDCIGEEFDALLQIAISNSNGNITRIDQHRMCLTLLENKDKARIIIRKLYGYLYGENENDLS